MNIDDELARYEAELNEALVEEGVKYAPVSLEWIETFLPSRRKTIIATDVNGRETTIEGIAEPRGGVNSTRDRHKWRDNLDIELRRAITHVDEMLGPYALGPIRVIPHDNLDGNSNQFLCFHIHVMLLSDSLREQPFRVDYWPYERRRCELPTVLKRQDIRKKMIEGRGRLDALTCCPVLARKMLMSDMKPSWLDLIEKAMEDQGDRQMPHFNQGNLVQTIELKRSIRWADKALIIYEKMPDSIIGALPGKPLGVVVESPLIPDGITIRSIKLKAKRTSLVTDAKPVSLKDVIAELQGD